MGLRKDGDIREEEEEEGGRRDCGRNGYEGYADFFFLFSSK